MTTAIAARIGAFLGAAASIGAMIIQQRYQSKRDLLKIASELALQDYKSRLEIAGRMPPVSAFVHYHFQVLEHMAKGTFTDATIKKLSEQHNGILSAYKRLSDERRAGGMENGGKKE